MYKLYESLSNQTKGKFKDIYLWGYYNELYDEDRNNTLFSLVEIEDNDYNNKEYLGFLKNNLGKVSSLGVNIISLLKDPMKTYYEYNSNSLAGLSKLSFDKFRQDYSYTDKSEIFKMSDLYSMGVAEITRNSDYILYEIWDKSIIQELSNYTGWCTKRMSWCEYYLEDASPGDYFNNILMLTDINGLKLAIINFRTKQLKDINNDDAPQYLEILYELWDKFDDYADSLKFESITN